VVSMMTSSTTPPYVTSQSSSYEDTDDDYYVEWRQACCDEMIKIETSFCDVRTLYHDERIQQVESLLDHVETSSAFLGKMQLLLKQRHDAIKMNRFIRRLKLNQINIVLTAEKFANQQNSQNEKEILIARFNTKLDKLQKNLETDREDAELVTCTTSNNDDDQRVVCSNPVEVDGPYIVYMLKEADIIQDWIAMKKAVNKAMRRQI